ncbi:MAG: hypothetical protein ACYDAJ_02980 [Nitrosotalea sp.]
MKTIPIFLAIILVSIPGVALAQSAAQITILTDKQSYVTGDTISISGTISLLGASSSAVLQIYNPFNVLMQIGTISVAPDGTFHDTIKAEGQSWSNDGSYQIKILYVSTPILATATANIVLNAAPSPVVSSPPPASTQPVAPQQSSQPAQSSNGTIVTPSYTQTPIEQQIQQRIALANKLKQQLDQNATTQIPFWVKDTARKWCDGTIDNAGFSKDIQYFISSGLVKTDGQITPTFTFDHIPSWVKQVTSWWTQGTISDYSYVNTIQFLLDEKIIK